MEKLKLKSMFERRKILPLVMTLANSIIRELGFVARQMNLSRPTISAIESGQRKVTAEELDRFSKLYGVSTEKLMHGTVSNTVETEMFARTFSELSDIDQKEIMNLIDFKRKYKEHMNS